MSSASIPRRGDVWLVNFDPTVGSEIRKTRPAVVLSSDGIGRLPIKLVAPLTERKDAFSQRLWLVRVDPDANNGLHKTSAADLLQVRGIDTRRLITPLGQVSPHLLEKMTAALAVVVELR